VGHVQLRPIGKVPAQSTADLLRAPLVIEQILNERAQLRAGGNFASLGSGAPGFGVCLGGMWPVPAGVGMAVTADLQDLPQLGVSD
jgi:hypothetical protein